MTDSAHYWRDASFGGIDLLSASYQDHAFSRHAHDECVLCLIEAGAEKFVVDGIVHIADAGTVVFMPPRIEHDGAADPHHKRWCCRAFYPRAEILESVLAAKSLQREQIFELRVHMTRAPAVADSLLAAHRCFEEVGQTRQAREATFLHTVGLLIDDIVAGLTLSRAAPEVESKLVQAAKRYVESHYAAEIDINVIAAAVGVSATHLMRVFHAGARQHLHGFVTQTRLHHARTLLLSGAAPADVAYATGFVDQSHLIRRFRLAFGATPGRYLRGTNPRR